MPKRNVEQIGEGLGAGTLLEDDYRNQDTSNYRIGWGGRVIEIKNHNGLEKSK